jgi:hypothetical protein
MIKIRHTEVEMINHRHTEMAKWRVKFSILLEDKNVYLFLFILFSQQNKGVIPKRYVPKATRTKEIHHTNPLRPLQVRCAQDLGGQRTPLQ